MTDTAKPTQNIFESLLCLASREYEKEETEIEKSPYLLECEKIFTEALDIKEQVGLTPPQLLERVRELEGALGDALALLNHMGDSLNRIDAVTDADLAFAEPIFKKVRAALAKHGEGV